MAIIQMWQHFHPAFVVWKRETNLCTDFRIVTLSTRQTYRILYSQIAVLLYPNWNRMRTHVAVGKI
jgi:hypothetical protein